MLRKRILLAVFVGVLGASLFAVSASRAEAPEFGTAYDVPWFVAYVEPGSQDSNVNYAEEGDPTSYIDDLGGEWKGITMVDFGGTWATSVIREMLWHDVNDIFDPNGLLGQAWTHTDSSRSLWHPAHGCYSDGEPNFYALHVPGGFDPNLPIPGGRPVNPGGATLTAVPGYGGSAYPAICFTAPEIGTYSFDGTVLLSGQKWRMYVRTYAVDGTATTIEPGMFSVDNDTIYDNEPIDLGAWDGATGIDLQAGDRIALHVYTPLAVTDPNDPPFDLSLNFDAYESDPVRIIKGFLPANPLGDLNDDYRVDFEDLAVMAGNWLVDCVATENADPACQ